MGKSIEKAYPFPLTNTISLINLLILKLTNKIPINNPRKLLYIFIIDLKIHILILYNYLIIIDYGIIICIILKTLISLIRMFTSHMLIQWIPRSIPSTTTLNRTDKLSLDLIFKSSFSSLTNKIPTVLIIK